MYKNYALLPVWLGNMFDVRVAAVKLFGEWKKLNRSQVSQELAAIPHPIQYTKLYPKNLETLYN